MPTNIGKDPISALKVGNNDVTAAYVGNSQIFPNVAPTKDISSLSSPGVACGANATLTVGGEIGATFTIATTLGTVVGGEQTLTAVSQNFTITLATNCACGSSQLNGTITVTPTGTTTISVSTTTSFTQAGGLANTVFTVPNQGQASGNTLAIYPLVWPIPTITVGSTVYFGTGAKFTVAFSYPQAGSYSPSNQTGYGAIPNLSLQVSLGTYLNGLTISNIGSLPTPATVLSSGGSSGSFYVRFTQPGGYSSNLPTTPPSDRYRYDFEVVTRASTFTLYANPYVNSLYTGACGSVVGFNVNNAGQSLNPASWSSQSWITYYS
jgi:hypothetical protein